MMNTRAVWRFLRLPKSIMLLKLIENGKLHISFADNGIPYNPLEATEPDTTLSAEEREIGGLGIFMVKKMTESMEYEYTDDKNILTLVIALS